MRKPAAPRATQSASSQPLSIPMRILLLLLSLAGLWVARFFILPIAWAVVLAIALWPLYQHFRPALSRRRGVLLALAFALATGLVLMVPLIIVAAEAVRDSQWAISWITRAQQHGIPAPSLLAHIPITGDRMTAWWQANLADPNGAAGLLGHVDAAAVARWVGSAAASFVSSVMVFFMALLALFLILRDGDVLVATCDKAARRVYGDFGHRFLDRLGGAVRGAVNGTVLVALGEGSLIGIGYALAGVPRPVLFTIVTIGFALLPFGAWFAFGLASLVLLLLGHVVAALIILGFGAAVMLIGDNVVQPALVGSSVELPFIWTLIATFGGIQAFGLVGLFLGPALFAALFLAWKEWMATDSGPHADAAGAA